MTAADISLVIIALAVIVLVIFLAKFLFAATKTLRRLNSTLGAVNKQIELIGREPRNLMHNVNAIAGDMRDLLNCLNPFFRSISNVGEGLEYKTSNFKEKVLEKNSKEKDFDDEEDEATIGDAVKLGLKGLSLWKKYSKSYKED